MKLHYFILIILIKVWPNLFKRYYEEYKQVAKNGGLSNG